jgi:hypothetical protein
MTHSSLRICLSISAGVALSLALQPQSQAASTTQFVCGNSGNIPTTMAQTKNGSVPVIRWNSDFFAKDGWTAQARCQEVSSRFEKYYQNGSLKFLTSGIMNGMSVICTTKNLGGNCENLLFTLKSGSNPSQELRQLTNVRNRAGGPLNETDGRVYINVEQLLNQASDKNSAKTVSNNQVW